VLPGGEQCWWAREQMNAQPDNRTLQWQRVRFTTTYPFTDNKCMVPSPQRALIDDADRAHWRQTLSEDLNWPHASISRILPNLL
jgi:hypothetical protein